MIPILLVVVLVIGIAASKSLRGSSRAETDDLKAKVEALKKLYPSLYSPKFQTG